MFVSDFAFLMHLIGCNMKENREAAFNAMVARHRDMIWHVCSDYSLSAAFEVEDGVQEVLCALWRCFDSFEGRSSERTWVYKVATNAMLMLYRKAGNRPSPLQQAEGHESPTVPDDENYRFLLQLIDQLDPSERQVLRAHLDGFSNNEISSITGLSLATIGRRLASAKKRLRKEYEQNK